MSAQLFQMLVGMGKALTFQMGMSADDAYWIPGLDESASDGELKKRHQEMLHKLHPDIGGVWGTECLLQMVMTACKIIKAERTWQ